MCNLLLVLFGSAQVDRYDHEQEEQRLLRRVELTHQVLQERVDLTVALLRGLLGLFEASQLVEPHEFRAYVEPLGIRERYPSILGLGYMAYVRPGGDAALVERIRSAGESFQVWPVPTSDIAVVVLYLEPRDHGNQKALGFDVWSEPTRRSALARARDTGETVATANLTLVQEEAGGGNGFLLFMPHYDSPTPLHTVAARRERIAGFVYAPVRVREFVQSALTRSLDLAVRVYSGPDTTASKLLYEMPSERAWDASLQRAIQIGGLTWTVLYQFREGPHPWWRSPAVPVLLSGMVFAGLLYRFQVVQVDARLRAQRHTEALRRGEQRYRFLAEAMPQVVFTADRAGFITYVNRPSCGLVAHESLVAGLTPRMDADAGKAVAESWEAAVRSGRDWHKTFVLEQQGQRRWHLGRAVAQRRGGVIVEWVGTMTDIEDQKQAEAALQREATELEARVAERTAELVRANRELENYAAVASHDLQEPLRKIVAFGDRLAESLGPDVNPASADSLARMRRSAQRLQRLIGDLLTFARISSTEVSARPVDLGRLTRAVASDLLEGRPETARIEVRTLPLARGDLGLLRQLLENLLSNAIKFSRPNTSAHVVVHAEDAGEEIAADRRAGFFRLLVEDEGIGFDPKYVDRIFQVFQRLHPLDRYEGTGIGLAICQRVAELHGGSITARRSPGNGACFVVTLPRATADPNPNREAASCAQEA